MIKSTISRIVSIIDLPFPRSSSRRSCREGGAFLDLFGDNPEARERVRTECRDHRNICGITAARDQDPADPRLIVSRVERKPATAKKGFEPSVEIHRRRIGRNTDVPEVAVAIARRDVETPA